ncbi:unnamed protein product [Dicrocoelium dendriticum]|nr:unnamed protein product [Dicrocoelium dendriticum]
MRSPSQTPLREQTRDVQLHSGFSTRSHIFIRTDTVLRPVQPSYTSLFSVLQRTPKYFTLCQDGPRATVYTDCIKVAFFDGLFATHPDAITQAPALAVTSRELDTPKPSAPLDPQPTTSPQTQAIDRHGR